jgi:hypothetical protein
MGKKLLQIRLMKPSSTSEWRRGNQFFSPLASRASCLFPVFSTYDCRVRTDEFDDNFGTQVRRRVDRIDRLFSLDTRPFFESSASHLTEKHGDDRLLLIIKWNKIQ